MLARAFGTRVGGSRRWSATKTPERAVGRTGAGPQDRGAMVDQDMLVDGGDGLPGPDRCPAQGRGQLGTLGPEYLACKLLGLGEVLGVVGGLGLGCLVTVDGGLVVGPLACAVSWRASAASARLRSGSRSRAGSVWSISPS
jgi:hypothetical protein